MSVCLTTTAARLTDYYDIRNQRRPYLVKGLSDVYIKDCFISLVVKNDGRFVVFSAVTVKRLERLSRN